MALNIKNERVHELAREAARRTGKSQTGAIEEALERLLAGLEGAPLTSRRSRIDIAVSELHAAISGRAGSAMSARERDLYDEAGLPT